jgi:hypothetical protein
VEGLRINVCFRVQSGHVPDIVKAPLMTQNRLNARAVGAMDFNYSIEFYPLPPPIFN